MSSSNSRSRNDRLWELAKIFLKLGTIGFGGPQAHIAMQNDEVVVRRNWLTADQFAEGMALCEMLPGPASTQMGIYIGYLQAGYLGALVTGFCFIAPAFLILVTLSWGYFYFQEIPQLEDVFLGVSPIVSAIILAFCWKLGKKAITDRTRGAIAILVLLVTVFTPIGVLFQFIVAGLLGLWFFRPRQSQRYKSQIPESQQNVLDNDFNQAKDPDPDQDNTPPSSRLNGIVLPSFLFSLSVLASSLTAVSADVLSVSSFWGLERMGEFAVPLSLFFLKVGSFIFGGGLVIIPLLEFEVVDKLHWLTRTEFINGVAIGQLSPGPVVLTAAFVGYKVAGVLGALVSTVAIFAPSFAFILLAAPLLLRIRQNLWISAFLQGVTPAVLGAIAAAAIPLVQEAVVQDSLVYSVAAAVIAVGAIIGLIRYKLPTWQLVPLGAVLGLLMGIIPIGPG